MIGGKVLDASALAELARHRPAAFAWLRTARELNIALYVPALALAEVRAVRPDAAPLLADLLTHPSVLVGELDAVTAEEVERLFLETGAFDALAGHVIHVAQRRRWPVLTSDPGRLHRIAPAVDVNLL